MVNILFANADKAGVFYYRTQLPATQLARDHSDVFNVTIENESNWNDLERLRMFDIIHVHREFTNNIDFNNHIFDFCKKQNILVITDVDDFWVLDSHHPSFATSKTSNFADIILNNIKKSDYVTTTTPFFADVIKKYNPNVHVLINAIPLTKGSQFLQSPTVDRESRKRVGVGYLAGSSHLHDIQYLNSMANILSNDATVRDSIQFLLVGFDERGSMTETIVNKDLIAELVRRKINADAIIRKITTGIAKFEECADVPEDLRKQYAGRWAEFNTNAIKMGDTVWYNYEKIFTDDYKIIQNPEYLKHLKRYEKDKNFQPIENELYQRIWTKSVGQYAKNYDHIDVSLAPLLDHKFNNCKSELKFIEAFPRKIAMVASDVIPYNVVGMHNKNSLLCRDERDFTKSIKKLVKNPELRKDLGEQLYEDFHIKYDLVNATKERADFYSSLIK